ncbi:MAG TPA: site-2 protease family protein, partial [Methanocorpusculum sp.]|nr:site-2 protease family protein [Methanocorpusculum sp.]
MEFGWVVVVFISVLVYIGVCWAIKIYNIRPEIFSFIGPCLMIRTSKTQIFDAFSRFRRIFLVYGTLGIFIATVCSILMTVIILLTAYMTMIIKPDPSQLIQPRNLLLIPGVNDFIPSTCAVWFALFFAVFIHEFGHGLLSRVENIRVKYTGILTLVLPIGAFVESDEDEIEKSKLSTKLRVFAAGISNNMVVGVVCLVVLSLLLGMIVPGTMPIVQGIYENSPADCAGIYPGTMILAIDGILVSNSSDVSTILSSTVPGQTIHVLGEFKGEQRMYDVTLTNLPSERKGSVFKNDSPGFMGILYSDPRTITDMLHTLTHPSTMNQMLVSVLSLLM